MVADTPMKPRFPVADALPAVWFVASLFVKQLAFGARLEAPGATVRRLKARYLHLRAPELGGIWSEPEHSAEAIRRIVQPGHYVLDVGAHLGSGLRGARHVGRVVVGRPDRFCATQEAS